MVEFKLKIHIEETNPQSGVLAAGLQLWEHMYYLELFSRLPPERQTADQVFRLLLRPWEMVGGDDVLRITSVVILSTSTDVQIEGTGKDHEAIDKAKEKVKEYLDKLGQNASIEDKPVPEQVETVASNLLLTIIDKPEIRRAVAVWLVLLSSRLRGLAYVE